MSNFSKLFDLVGELARRRYQAAERSFAALGLNHTEARLLTLLHQEGGEATQEALSSMLFVDRSNAGRALKGLEQMGLVARRKDEADKRTNYVRMTTQGHTVVTEVAKVRREMAQGFFGDLSEEQAGTIVQLFQEAFQSEARS